MKIKELEIELTDDKKIYGELDSPDQDREWRTIILFHGSGPSDRHGTVESMGKITSQNFDILTEKLVEAGFAVFRYDKKESFDIDVIVKNAEIAIDFVQSLPEVKEIIFYGWSEGVRVCSTLISKFPAVTGMILQSGIAKGWSSYFSYILKELTIEKFKELDTDHDGILDISNFNYCVPDATSVTFALYLLVLNVDKNGKKTFTEVIDPEQKGKFSINDNWLPLANEIVSDPTSLTRFAENAPGETWKGILDDIKMSNIPILVLHGLNDGWISPIESVKIAQAARNHADVVLFKGLGHSMSQVDSPLADEGGTMNDKVISTIIKWLDINVN